MHSLLACRWAGFMVPTPVSPASSGPAPRWGASRTDRSGSGDRFAAERHWRSLPPSRAYTKEVYIPSQAREGDYNL